MSDMLEDILQTYKEEIVRYENVMDKSIIIIVRDHVEKPQICKSPFLRKQNVSTDEKELLVHVYIKIPWNSN